MYPTMTCRTDKRVTMDEERGLIRKVRINFLIGSVVMAQGIMVFIWRRDNLA